MEELAPDGSTGFFMTYPVPDDEFSRMAAELDGAACEYITARVLKAGRDIARPAQASDSPNSPECVPRGYRLRQATVWVDEFDVVTDLEGDRDGAAAQKE